MLFLLFLLFLCSFSFFSLRRRFRRAPLLSLTLSLSLPLCLRRLCLRAAFFAAFFAFLAAFLRRSSSLSLSDSSDSDSSSSLRAGRQPRRFTRTQRRSITHPAASGTTSAVLPPAPPAAVGSGAPLRPEASVWRQARARACSAFSAERACPAR